MTSSHLAADVQKFSKQAIFAAHRGDIKHVTKLLADAEAVSAEILPILTELPTLRYGSFSNAMEEVRPKPSSQSARVLFMRAAELHGDDSKHVFESVLA